MVVAPTKVISGPIKEGIELFALELLKSARDLETLLSNNGTYSNPFAGNENWIDVDSHTVIPSVGLEPFSWREQSLRAETKVHNNPL